MAQTYTRQSTFADGDTITASLFNDEYNQLVNVFAYSSTDASSTGHRHDGTAAQGGNIPKIGDLDFLNKIEVDSTNNRWGFYVEVSSAAVEQVRIQDGAIVPVTDNDIDLGTSSLEFKDLYIDGTANIDTLSVDTSATIAGLTVSGTSTLQGDIYLGNASADTIFVPGLFQANLIPENDSLWNLGSTSLYWANAYVDAITTTGDVAVGGNLTVTGTTTFNGGTITMGDAASDNVVFGADVNSNIIPNTDNTYDLGSSSQEWKDIYIDGTAYLDAINFNGTAITATAAELNIMDGVTATATEINLLDGVTSTTAELNIVDGDTTATSTTLADADRVVVNDAGTMVQVALTDFETYFESALDTLSNVTTVGALNAGSITSGFGAIDNGSSAITTTGTVTYGSLSDGTIIITAFVDEDDMSSDSATLVPTQQSVKAYVDSQVTAQDLDFQGDSGGALSIDLDSETLTFTGGTGVDTSGSGNAITFAIDSTVTTLTGSQTLTNKTLTSPDINTPDIDGGTIDGTVIGGASAAAGTFTTFTSTGIDDNATSTAITIDSSENVGIGTTSVATKLNIRTDASDDGILLEKTDGTDIARLFHDGTTTNGRFDLFSGGSAAVQIRANGDTHFSGGNVGIGTASPDQTLHVHKGSAGTITSQANSVLTLENSASAVLQFLTPNTGDQQIRFGDPQDNGAGYINYSHGASALTFGVNGPERMRINSSGNVGIGETNPSRTLDIKSANPLNINTTSNNHIHFQVNDVTTGQYVSTSSLPHQLCDSTGAVPRLVVDSSGNVGIGSTSNHAGARVVINDTPPTAFGSPMFQVGQETFTASGYYSIGLGFTNGTYTEPPAEIAAVSTSSSGGTTADIIFGTRSVTTNTAVTERMRIDSSGQVGIGTTPIAHLSVNAGGSPDAQYGIANFGAGSGVDSYVTVSRGGNDAGGIKILRGSVADLSIYVTAAESSIINYNGGDTNDGLYFRAGSASTDVMTLDSSGNVGIGTTSPNGKLDITGSGNTDIYLNTGNNSGDNNRLFFGDTADIDVGYLSYDHGTNTMSFGVNATERMRIDSSGNVGIGTSSPSSYGFFAVDRGAPASADSTIASFMAQSTRRMGLVWDDSQSTLGLANLTSQDLCFHIGGIGGANEKMRINSTGSLILTGGGGTVTDTHGTASRTNLQLDGSSETIITFSQSGTTRGYLNATSNSFDLVAGTGSKLRFLSNGSASTAVTLDTSGNLLVGCTSFGSVSTEGCQLGNSGTAIFSNDSDVPLYLNRTTSGVTTSQVVVSFFRNDVQSGTIGVSQGGTPAFGAPSDIRLKENVTDHKSELTNVMALRPVRWDWKDSSKGAGEGFVAQELEQTAWADLVSEGEDGYKMVSGLGAVETRLIKALQEAVTRIETLEAEVAALKGE